EVFSRRRGVATARAVATRHRGTLFDPDVADLFCGNAAELVAGLDEAGNWDAVLAAEPRLSREVSGSELDGVLAAMADLVDLKSPYLAGHSRGVASLAEAAARIAGLSEEDAVAIRRAGLVHDLGRLGVSNTVWDRPGPLTEAEIERVRLHPYLTDRMLARVPALRRSREIAAHLRGEARAGRLDGDAVQSVLRAAGQRAPARRDWPAGLTAREVEVLGLLARGHANKAIAQRLVVTPKTVSNHVEHIYAKIGVSTRAAATLFAMQQGLVGSFEPAGQKMRRTPHDAGGARF